MRSLSGSATNARDESSEVTSYRIYLKKSSIKEIKEYLYLKEKISRCFFYCLKCLKKYLITLYSGFQRNITRVILYESSDMYEYLKSQTD